MNSAAADFSQGATLLRGDSEEIARWIERFDSRRLLFCLAVIFIGSGLFSASLGLWRAPLQALYGGLKLPLVILLTTFGNALLNGMLAPLLGLNITFRQSLLAILLSFTIAAILLGGFSPILLFVVWNTPSMAKGATFPTPGYDLLLMFEVGLIALAGTMANVRLLKLLRQLSGSRQTAMRILLAWLAGNLLLGAQLSWILRPFIGSPAQPVTFLSGHAFEGNFYEAVFAALKHLLTS